MWRLCDKKCIGVVGMTISVVVLADVVTIVGVVFEVALVFQTVNAMLVGVTLVVLPQSGLAQ